MANYEYHGCVTGFSESDTVTLWQPDVSPLSVERQNGEYTERLVKVSLLSSNSEAVFECRPSIFEFSDLTWDASQFIEGVAEPWNGTGVAGYVVMAKVITKDGEENVAYSTTSHGTMKAWSPVVSMLFGAAVAETTNSKRFYKADYQRRSTDPTQRFIGMSPYLLMEDYLINDDYIDSMLRQSDGLVVTDETTYAMELRKGIEFIHDPSTVTITSVPSEDIQAVHHEVISSRDDYHDIQFVDIYNGGKDIILHSCGYLQTYDLPEPIPVTDANFAKVMADAMNNIKGAFETKKEES